MADKVPELTFSDIAKITADVRSEQGPGEATKEINRKVIEAFRATGGQLTGELKGGHLVLVTMTGSKSGKQRTVPLGYVETEGRIFILASRGGTVDNPVWYNNIKANPEVTVEYKAEKFPATAVELQGEERDRIFEVAKRQIPDFGDYEKRTTRKIPVIELRRKS